jgi:DNA-binding Lrp family transcriptional regulator
MTDDGFAYTGVHAFVFIDSVDPGTNIRDVIDALRSFGPPPDGPVYFASEMVGSYLGFAHVRTETLAELQDLIAGELWARGAHSAHCVEAAVAHVGPLLVGVKRGTPEVIALVRVRTNPGALDEVLQAMADEEGPLRNTFKGASVTFGDFDILLQLGADSFEAVASDVYGPLQDIDGIVSTDSAFTDARRYED